MKFVLLVSVIAFTACSGGELHSDDSKNLIQLPYTTVEINESPNSQDEIKSTENDIADQRVVPPTPINGSYLECTRLTDSSLANNEASIGCSFVRDKVKVTIAEGTTIDWGSIGGEGVEFTFSVLPPTDIYHGVIRVKTGDEQQLSKLLTTLKINASINGQSLESSEISPQQALNMSTEICGGAGEYCYDDATAIANGVATTPSGKSIEYVLAGGSFYVWKEVSGNRILKADGSDNWAKKLNTNGKGFTATDFTAYTGIVGRVCPTNVYIDDANKFTTGNCLYYTTEGSQTLNAYGTNDILGMDTWSTVSWYVGNVKVCSDKGMRLPAMFETTITNTSNSQLPTGDGTPTYALGTGVPSLAGATWTGSSNNWSTSNMWAWNGTSTHGSPSFLYTSTAFVRCVLP